MTTSIELYHVINDGTVIKFAGNDYFADHKVLKPFLRKVMNGIMVDLCLTSDKMLRYLMNEFIKKEICSIVFNFDLTEEGKRWITSVRYRRPSVEFACKHFFIKN